jgi:putative transposase
MSSLFVAFCSLLASTFRTHAALQAEILALRHQLAVFQKNAPHRLRLHRCDRLLWVVLYRFWSGWRRCLQMVKPGTVLRWHRRAFALHWTRKSRRLPGRPEVAANIRDLIQRMSQANPLWGAPRIHGELLRLGIAVAQSTVARHLSRSRKPPSQTWRTFLTNHLAQTAAIDFFTVPTATFRVLFVFVVLSHERRRVVHFGVTEHPTREWTMPQMRELGPGTPICAARSTCHLRNRLRGHDPRYGNQGSAYCTAIPLAKSLCGAVGGLHPTRVPGPRDRVE